MQASIACQMRSSAGIEIELSAPRASRSRVSSRRPRARRLRPSPASRWRWRKDKARSGAARPASRRRGCASSSAEHEAAADRIEGALGENRPGRVERAKDHAVGVAGQRRPVDEDECRSSDRRRPPGWPIAASAASRRPAPREWSAPVRVDVVRRLAGEASAIARSVPWPLPVKASEPCRLTVIRRAAPAEGRQSSARKRRAATIGPTVCELDGPMPILKMSKTLRNIAGPFRPGT